MPLIRIVNRLAIHHIKLPLERILRTNRHQNCMRIGTELLAHIIDDIVEISTHPVHLVHKNDPWHFVFIRLTPNRL